MLSLFEEARSEYTKRLGTKTLALPKYDKPMCFVVEGKEFCEKSFAYLVGMADATKKSTIWYSIMEDFLQGMTNFSVFIIQMY